MRLNTAILLAALAGLAACSPAPSKNTAGTGAKAMPAQAKSIALSSKPAPKPVKMWEGPLLFHGYPCESDCSSHEQGYSWASAHQISNPMDCHGTSETFIEGCRAFAGIEGPFGRRVIDASFPHMTGFD